MAAGRLRAIAAALLLAATARAEYVSKAPGTGVVIGGPLDFPAGSFKSEGTVYRFGNSAGRVPVLDSGAKLPVAQVPGLPASIITSGTFADDRIASASIWSSKEPALGNPAANGYALVSTTGGVRTWVPFPAGVSAATAPLNWNAGTQTLSIALATSSTAGYLSAADWVAFNAKQAAITTGSTAQYLRGDLSLATLNKAAVAGLQDSDNVVFGYVQSTGSSAGFLFSERDATGADWIAYSSGGIFRLYNGTDRLTLGATGNLSVTGTLGGSNFSGSSSGANTGDQTITLTGNVTGSGTGTFAATIANSAVTLAKMADMATASLIYRKTAGAGPPEVNTLATLKTDLGLTGTNSGDVTLAGQSYLSIAGQVITANAVDLGTSHATGTLAAARAPAFTGDVTSSSGSLTLTIGAGTVTLAKMANVATGTVFYRKTAGAGAPEVQTLATLKTDMSLNLVENTALSTWGGSTSLVTLGTVTAGTWNASVLTGTYGGTGVNNGTKTITLGGNLATSGAFATTITVTGTTGVTLPTSGTLVGSADTGTVTNTMLAGSIANAKLLNSTITIAGTSTALGASITSDTILGGLSTTGFVKRTGANTYAIDASTYLTGNQTVTLSGDVSGSGATAITTAIGANKVTLAMMAQVATATFLGRTTAATGNVEAMTVAQAKALLNLSNTNSGDVTVSGQTYVTLSGQALTIGQVDLSGTHVTGTLAAARMPAHTGDVTSSAGSVALTIANVVTAGTATKITYNAKGQVTAGTTLAAGDIPGTLNATIFAGSIRVNSAPAWGNFSVHASTDENLAVMTHFSNSAGVRLATANDALSVNVPLEIAASYSTFPVGGVNVGGTTNPGVGNLSVTGSLTTGGAFLPGDYDIGVAGSYSANVVLLGDSLQQQLGGINSYFGTGSVPALGTYNGIAVSPSQGQNVAVAGTTVQYWRDNAGLLNTAYRREAGLNIAVPLIGTNTLTTKTAKEVYSEIEALCRHLRATGWRVVLVGLLSRGGSNGNGTYDSQVGVVNAFLRQNWAQFADRFIDWGVIGGGSNPFNTGGYSNGTYYTGDQLHQQVAGAQALAGYEAAAINDLLIYYFQTHRNQFFVNMNKASHTNDANNGMMTLRNENPSAGQSEINFSFYNGSAYVLKENIRGDSGGVLNYGATVGHIFYAGSTGPDVYGTNGSDGPPSVFAISNTSVVSYKGLSVTGPVSYGGTGLYFGHDGTTSIITSVNSGVIGKALDIYGYPIRFLSSNTGALQFTTDNSGINLGASLNYSASGASVMRVSDNSNNVLNPVTNSGSIYMNWDRGTAGLGTIFGNGGGTTVARVSIAGGFAVGTSGDPGAGNVYAANHITLNAPLSDMGYPLWVGQYSSDRAVKITGGYRTTGMRVTANNNADTALVPLELLGTFVHINQGGLIVGDWTSPANPGDGNIKMGAGSAKGGSLGFGNDGTRVLSYVNLSGTEYYNFADTPTVSAQAYLTRSSRTLKTNIKDWDGDVRTKRRRLHPRTFELKGAPGKERVGFVAEEVAEVLPEAASYVPAPGPDGVPVPGYDTTVIVAKHELELQEALDKIEDLEAAIASLQGKPAPKRRPDADKAPLPTPPPAPSAAPKPSPPPPATPAPSASPTASAIPVETPRPAETVAPSPTPQATATAAAKPKATPKRSPTPRR